VTLEKKFTVGDIIALGALLIAVIFGVQQSCMINGEIDLLKQNQQPYLIGSITWSNSTSLEEHGDELFFSP